MHFRKRTSSKQLTPAMTAEKFCEYVNFLTDLYRLDPELQELARLKGQAEELVSLGVPRPHYFLVMLNPDDNILVYEGIKILQERWFGHILEAWTIARHHCPRLDEDLVKIVVDSHGAHLFTSHFREHEVFCVRGAAINPHRLADPGNRYQIGCEIIRQFTGVEIDFREHVGSTRAMVATKGLDGNWNIEFDRVSVVSG